MRNDRLVFAKDNKTKTNNYTISGNNSTKNYSDTTDSTDTIEDTEDDPERPPNIIQSVWIKIKESYKWLKEHGLYEEIEKLLKEYGIPVAVKFCDIYIGHSLCEEVTIRIRHK